MLEIYTSRIKYSGENKLDITIGTGDKVFAPSWEIVIGHKRGKITDKQYTNAYIKLMRISYKRHKKRWNEILNKDKIVFCCYCSSDKFCHRYILANIFTKLGAKYCGEIK